MRTRSAKKLAQRIDLNYFKHAHPLRRWRTVLSIAAPVVGLLWLGGMAAAGSRAAYSSGPLSTAHAFAEAKCEVCHVRDTSFRAHVGDSACLICHDAPVHAGRQIAPPACATCHREHQGRVELAKMPEAFCVRCHGDLSVRDPGRMVPALPGVNLRPKAANAVTGFPSLHPEFSVIRSGAKDAGSLKFNHAVHMKDELRGPSGPETLQCTGCHKPEMAPASSQRRLPLGSMSPLNYQQQCARCHPLFFDERIDAQAPHQQTTEVYAFVERALREYIAAHPADISKPDPPPRRLPLNFPLPPGPLARNADEWVAGKLGRAEKVLRIAMCGGCHDEDMVVPPLAEPAPGAVRPIVPLGPRFQVRRINLAREWMPRAKFDHRPHLMVECTSCHAAGQSTKTSDVLMPKMETCAMCHAPGKGAESRCFECHGYHDWTKEHAVEPRFKATDFK
jgi:predicted CXXCH cytochrome family protein